MLQQQEQAELANRFAMMKMLADQRQTQTANLFARENQQYGRGQDALAQRLAADRFQKELALKSRIAEMQYGDVGGEREYPEAHRAITEGMLTPEQLPEAFPNLPPNLRGRLGAYHGNLANQEQQEVDALSGDANTLNEQLSLMRLTKGLADAKTKATQAKKGWNWLPGPHLKESQVDAQLSATTQSLTAGRGKGVELPPQQISDFLNLVFKNRRFSESVRFDPETQSFQPVQVPRRFSLSRAPASAMIPDGTPPTTFAGGVGTMENPIIPVSPDHFDKIPSGLIYRNPADGKLYRKK